MNNTLTSISVSDTLTVNNDEIVNLSLALKISTYPIKPNVKSIFASSFKLILALILSLAPLSSKISFIISTTSSTRLSSST